MDHRDRPDLNRIPELARERATTDSGAACERATTDSGAACEPPGELADAVAALAARVDGLSARVDALWRLISAVVESAGLRAPDADGPPADFVAAVEDARSTGRRGVRLNIGGRQWVAALSQQPPTPDPASWSAIERVARQAGDQDEM
jgi:hypothetical protein